MVINIHHQIVMYRHQALSYHFIITLNSFFGIFLPYVDNLDPIKLFIPLTILFNRLMRQKNGES